MEATKVYSIDQSTIEWVNTGGNVMMAIAQCDTFLHDENGISNDNVWFGVTADYFCVYADHPFASDEEALECFFLPDCKAVHGAYYKFDDWTQPGNAMCNLYRFFESASGQML